MPESALTLNEVSAFQNAVLDWYQEYGRKNLPWQLSVNPYRVWVSEIMLQQTQVAVVIPYFKKFVARFPDIETLAFSSQDDVLAMWSGLGYYSRARNLHRTAQIVSEEYKGELPHDIEALISLPGIGRSTAGAILSLSLGYPHPILDGNVKRVLARCFAVEGWPGKSDVLKQHWSLSEKLTPRVKTGHYNQAMMDIGATLCTRSSPDCESCPVKDVCIAKSTQTQTDYPGKRVKKKLPERTIKMLVLINDDGEILLEKRPSVGIWGGLWSLPESHTMEDALAWYRCRVGTEIAEIQRLPERRHSFSHFHLDIEPVAFIVENHATCVMDADRYVWYKPQQIKTLGVAAPVARIIGEIRNLE